MLVSGSPRAGSLPLIAGALALDFCNTTTGRGTDQFVEHLFDYQDLMRWSVHAGLLPPPAAAALEARAGDTGPSVFERARDLRSLLNGVFDRAARRQPVEPAALATLAARHREVWADAALVEQAGSFAWRLPDAGQRPDGVLAPILCSAVEVLTARDLSRLKACPGVACGWVFLDDTKNGNRVWCEMEVCGTRAKLRNRAERRRRAAGR